MTKTIERKQKIVSLQSYESVIPAEANWLAAVFKTGVSVVVAEDTFIITLYCVADEIMNDTDVLDCVVAIIVDGIIEAVEEDTFCDVDSVVVTGVTVVVEDKFADVLDSVVKIVTVDVDDVEIVVTEVVDNVVDTVEVDVLERQSINSLGG